MSDDYKMRQNTWKHADKDFPKPKITKKALGSAVTPVEIVKGSCTRLKNGIPSLTGFHLYVLKTETDYQLYLPTHQDKELAFTKSFTRLESSFMAHGVELQITDAMFTLLMKFDAENHKFGVAHHLMPFLDVEVEDVAVLEVEDVAVDDIESPPSRIVELNLLIESLTRDLNEARKELSLYQNENTAPDSIVEDDDDLSDVEFSEAEFMEEFNSEQFDISNIEMESFTLGMDDPAPISIDIMLEDTDTVVTKTPEEVAMELAHDLKNEIGTEIQNLKTIASQGTRFHLGTHGDEYEEYYIEHTTYTKTGKVVDRVFLVPAQSLDKDWIDDDLSEYDYSIEHYEDRIEWEKLRNNSIEQKYGAMKIKRQSFKSRKDGTASRWTEYSYAEWVNHTMNDPKIAKA